MGNQPDPGHSGGPAGGDSPGEETLSSLEVGILSDTHGLLRPEVLRHLEGVDRILHAGDVGSADVLVELEALAPVAAVWGNTDGFDLRGILPEVQHLTLGGLDVAVVHGYRVDALTPGGLAEHFPTPDLVVFGHTHRPLIRNVGGRWFVNPGSCGPRRFERPVTLVRARVSAGTFTPRLLHLS